MIRGTLNGGASTLARPPRVPCVIRRTLSASTSTPPGVQNRHNPLNMNIELTPENAEALAKYAELAAHAQKKAISSQFVMKLLLFVTFTLTLCAMRGMAQMPNP